MTTWADWRDEIAKACDGSHQNIESIEADLNAGRAEVLLAPGCCFVVSVHTYPMEKACHLDWFAGDIEAGLAALDALHAWAKAKGCTEMLSEGRFGWARVLGRHGYALWSQTLRRPL